MWRSFVELLGKAVPGTGKLPPGHCDGEKGGWIPLPPATPHTVPVRK